MLVIVAAIGDLGVNSKGSLAGGGGADHTSADCAGD